MFRKLKIKFVYFKNRRLCAVPWTLTFLLTFFTEYSRKLLGNHRSVSIDIWRAGRRRYKMATRLKFKQQIGTWKNRKYRRSTLQYWLMVSCCCRFPTKHPITSSAYSETVYIHRLWCKLRFCLKFSALFRLL